MRAAFPVRPDCVIAGLLLAGSLAGCATSGGGIRVESYPQHKITVNSFFFGGQFEVAEIRTAERNGLMVASVTLDNKKREKDFEYRYRWLDGDGIEVTTGMGVWVQKHAGGRERMLLTGIAPTKQVRSFILDMRYIQSSKRWY